jgi:heat shock protein HtpX
MFQAYGLVTHIRANRARSVILLVALFAMAFVMAFGLILIFDGVRLGFFDYSRRPSHYAIGVVGAPLYRHGARLQDHIDFASQFSALLLLARGQFLAFSPVIAAATAAWAVCGTLMSQSMIQVATGARSASSIIHGKLFHLLENLCISRGIATPRLEIIDDAALNAYASGFGKGNYAITVTTGLLETLDSDEIEAVLGHELTHIRNEDVRMMTFAGVIVGALAFIADFLIDKVSRFRFGIARSGANDKNGAVALAAIACGFLLVVFAWVSSALIRLSLSRKREFLADAGSVELTKNPDAMITALIKISGNSALARAPSGLMEMCIDNPKGRFIDLFSTHPSIERRIAALQKYAGGRERSLLASTPRKPSFAEMARKKSGRAAPVAAPAVATVAAPVAEPVAAAAPATGLVGRSAFLNFKKAPVMEAVNLDALSAQRLRCARVVPQARAG